MYICGIDTSFDDTSISIINNNKIILNKIITYDFSFYKGVIPNKISNYHKKNIYNIFINNLKKKKINLFKIDLIAVTYGPGLFNSLLIGINFSKILSIIINKPIYKINHLHAHILSFFIKNSYINKNKIKFPFISLLISGGNTYLSIIYNFFKIKVYGKTLDNPIGEIYDKIANLLNIKYPGGKKIDKFSKKGKNIFKIKIPIIKGYNFSFSGIYTFFKKKIFKNKYNINDICLSFQNIIFKILFNKIYKLYKKKKINNISIVGGVSSNKYIINKFIKYSKLYK
ncbi:MAG: tRNA (adenosine(37)-N6)-threonylcarbamoyltransferase complex transferase subunit TsaD [Candidatus Shikimatogenerans sp. Ttur]|uniref:N(6)-L-threonylcarbamoyladenine synthase n=1 Tax=Candidatus Shikimatogenerans sp. Ttur TaxID=3158569 RepID=A0AAU7ZYU1_9FLAO